MRFPTFALAQISVVLGLLLTAGSQSAAAQGCTYKVVAFTGQTAPGGGTFYNFYPPSIGAGNDVGFIGVDSRNDLATYGVYVGQPGSAFNRVAATGDAVPGIKNATFADFSAVSVSKDGGISFNAGISSDGYSTGIWLVNPGGVTTGGAGDPTEFSVDTLGTATYRSGTMFAKGTLTILGDIQQEGPSTGALFNGATTELSNMLTEGAVLNGQVVQKIYDTGDGDGAVGPAADSNESGAVALKIALAPPTTPSASPTPTPDPTEAIYAGSPLTPTPVAVQFAAAPGVSGSTYNHLSQRPSIAANGLVAFSSSLSSDSDSSPASAIFSGAPGAVLAKVLENSIVPTTTNITFGTLSDAVVNSTGDVIFRATINYPNGTTRDGIWIQRASGPPVLVAISGMSLPTPSGPQVATSVDFAGPGTFNDLHQFVFLARFGDANQGIYLADTRPGAPFVRVNTPRKPRDFVTTDTSVKVVGSATDDTGVDKVEYTVAREDASSNKKGGPKPHKRKMIVSRVKRAKGDANFHFDVPLKMGLNLISIVATDKLGNVSEAYKIRMLRYDSTAK